LAELFFYRYLCCQPAQLRQKSLATKVAATQNKKMTRLSIKNAQFVLILLLIAVLVGVRSFMSMPRSEDPQVELPIYLITAAYPGTSPEDMESLVLDPLEKVLKDITDITKIKSKIKTGIVVIVCEGAYDVDFEDTYDEIVREVNSVQSQLPQNLAFFNIEQISPSERVSFCMYALTSENTPYHNLQLLAEELEDEINDIDGLGAIDIFGYPKREIRVSLDYERMAARNVNLKQVANVLQGNNVNIPGGEVVAGSKIFNIQSTKGFDNLEEIRNSIVAVGDNRVVYLKDIATVNFAYEDQLRKIEYQQEKAILIGIKLKNGYNILHVDKELQERAQTFADRLPSNVKLNVAFEQASAVDKRLNDFFMNLIQGILLVGLVILLSLGWRSAFIITILIPFSIILALAMLNGAGYGLQQISIAALVLALGLLVDNGIVVLENINRFIKNGMDKKLAAQKGTEEVSFAIIASTVTTLLSFFPLSQLGDGAGLFLASLPLTVIFTLIISLILALTFSPIMSQWILTNKISEKDSLADKFFKAWIEKIYRPSLLFSLKRGWLIVLLAAGVFAFSISLFPKIGVSFFPTADKPLLLIDIDTPDGSNLETTEKAVNFVEDLLDTMEVIKDYTSHVGNGSPQIYYNRIPKQFLKNHGQVVANMTRWEATEFYRTIGELRLAFSNYPGAKITIEELKNAVPVDAPIEVRILGKNLEKIKTMAMKVEQLLRETPGVININNPIKRQQSQITIVLDKEKAGLLGVTELDFDRTVRASLNGIIIDKITADDDEEYNLVIRMPFDEKPSITDFGKIYVTSLSGGQIPLNHIAKVSFSEGLASFGHYNLDRTVRVQGSVENLDNTMPVSAEIKEKLDQMEWIDGVSYNLGGEYEEQQKTFGNLGIILLLAQVGIFAVLVLQFKSITQPLIVFSAIPLAITGSFLALYLTGWKFSFFAFVGLISLIGIVVNSSIILVDYINQLRSEGMELQEAIIEGSLRRFKPIVLTTITTILGLLPLTIQETNQWSPLCWTIIGGMISSSVLTLVVVPVLYGWFSKKERRT
jgi:multidrug efflux pump subunit AcrB